MAADPMFRFIFAISTASIREVLEGDQEAKVNQTLGARNGQRDRRATHNPIYY
jgi:hypothetical protein